MDFNDMMNDFKKNMPELEKKTMNEMVRAKSKSGILEVGVNLRKFITYIKIDENMFEKNKNYRNLENELTNLLNKALQEAERRTNMELQNFTKKLNF